MSCSSTVGKAWAKRTILELAPQSIIDVGVGRGTYRNLVGDDITAYWIGIEVFEPYVQKYRLHDKYDEIVIADATWVDWSLFSGVDLAICGDVLEHLDTASALRVWDGLRSISKHVLLSIPIGEYPQGASAGNRFEAHISTWTVADCMALPGVVRHEAYSSIGVFLAEGARG